LHRWLVKGRPELDDSTAVEVQRNALDVVQLGEALGIHVPDLALDTHAATG
jgi:hypothetical protein